MCSQGQAALALWLGIIFKHLNCVYMSVCVWVCACVSAGALRVLEDCVRALELVSQATVNCPVCMLKTELSPLQGQEMLLT